MHHVARGRRDVAGDRLTPRAASTWRYRSALSTTRVARDRWSRRAATTARVATRSHDPTIIAVATSTVAATVIRSRTVPHEPRATDVGPSSGISVGGVRDQAVAGTAHGEDGLHAERRVDLLADVADVDLDDVRVALEVGAPDLVEQLGLRDDRVGAAHQQLEQRELARGEIDRRRRRARHCRAAGSSVRSADREHGRARGVPPRRSSARSRATSTTNENGFDRKSSAPVSSASASS